MTFRITLLLIIFTYTSQVWAHAGGFVERCDKFPLPTCTYDWNAVNTTDSALYLVGGDGYCVIYNFKGGIRTINVGITDTLTGVKFINASVGYVWGKNGKILKTINGGLSWTQIITGISTNIDKAIFIDENNAFFMSGSIVYKTINGGVNWSSITLPDGAAFKDFHFFDSQNGQICGKTTSLPNTGYLYQTTDGGINWTLLYTDTIAFNKLQYIGAQGYLYGSTANTPLLLSSNDSGANWNILYNSNGWKLKSDIVLYKNLPVFITNEAGGDFLYNCPYFLDPYYGLLYYPKNIHSATVNGVESLYIIESSGLYRYTYGELLSTQFNFATDINPNPENCYNTFAPNKKIRFKALVTNASEDSIISVRGLLKCRSPYVRVTDSIAIYHDIKGNATFYNSVWSSDEYEIEISDNTPIGYIAHFEFTYDNSVPNGQINKSCFSMPILFSPFVLDNLIVVDSATENTTGNKNGIVEPMETAQMKTYIRNASQHYFGDIYARLHCLFSEIYIWNNYARPDGGGVVYSEYSLGSYNPGDTRIPGGSYTYTDSFEVNFDIPFILTLRGPIAEFRDPSGCTYSYFYNILYKWEIQFNVNNQFGIPPDSLKSECPVPITDTTPLINSIPLKKQGSSWNIFPNPTDGKFTLASDLELGNISFTNMLGQSVNYSLRMQSKNTANFDISSQPPGIYFLTLNNKTVKIIKH